MGRKRRMPLVRREILGWSAMLLGLVTSDSVADGREFARHLPATVASSAGLPVPGKQRAPFGWQVTAITTADRPPLVLRWDALPEGAEPTHFRVAIGLDERDEKIAEAFLPASGRVIGAFDLRFVSQFQVYQVALGPADVADIRREGIALRLTRGSDLY